MELAGKCGFWSCSVSSDKMRIEVENNQKEYSRHSALRDVLISVSAYDSRLANVI